MYYLRINSKLATYLEYILEELVSFQIYLSTIVIGLTICLFTDNYSIVPFVVPLIVQVLSRSNIRYRHRHIHALVELPAQTDDPAFIMDMKGDVILSIGYTLNLFKKHSIVNIKDFIGQKALDDILDMTAERDLSVPYIPSVEGYSKMTGKWYEIKAKPTGIRYGERTQKVLVWFLDMSLRKI